MTIERTFQSYLERHAKQRHLEPENLDYAGLPIIADGGNNKFETDVILISQYYAFTLGKYLLSGAVIQKEGAMMTLDQKYLTDEQKAVLSEHFLAHKLKPISKIEESVVIAGAIETICFAGQEFATSPFDLGSRIVKLEENIVVPDFVRVTYSSFVNPNRQALNTPLNPENQISQQVQHQQTIEVRHDQSPTP